MREQYLGQIGHLLLEFGDLSEIHLKAVEVLNRTKNPTKQEVQSIPELRQAARDKYTQLQAKIVEANTEYPEQVVSLSDFPDNLPPHIRAALVAVGVEA